MLLCRGRGFLFLYKPNKGHTAYKNSTFSGVLLIALGGTKFMCKNYQQGQKAGP